MYQNPVLFPAISNRESWGPIIAQIVDGDTNELIDLTGFTIALEIIEAPPLVNGSGYGPVSWGVDGNSPIISASLSDYISVVDTGTLQILIPKSVMISLRPMTYDVYATITQTSDGDTRQLLIGRLPVLYGGRNT